ncbi:MAG TPA: S-layer homology domain-containing protein [Clostridiaceae bacterium]|nr:S-layer homology domain-containing protein [Clostridiaceae bacterium]
MVRVKKLKVKSRHILVPLILFAIIFTSFFWNTGLSYGANDPDVTVYVHGEQSRGGPIFNQAGGIGNGLWAPGMSDKGTLRIINNYSSRIKVSNLGLALKLEKEEDEGFVPVNDPELIKIFAENMKLTVRKGRLLVFSSTIFNGSFYDMLYEKDSEVHKGFDLSPGNTFNINKNDHVDLEYEVKMDERAGNELQGLKATVSFLVNVHENPEPPRPPEPPKPPVTDGDGGDKISIPDAEGKWYSDCIIELIRHGILEPYEDGTVRPENYLTRAEMAVLMGRALKLENKVDGKSPYKDKLPDWARGYIISTSEVKVFIGYPGKVFKPDNNITREEFTAVLVRAFKKELIDDSDLEFKDKDKIGGWAYEYIRIAVQNGVILGYEDGTFRPKDNITRAEAFTILCKLLGYHKLHDKN